MRFSGCGSERASSGREERAVSAGSGDDAEGITPVVEREAPDRPSKNSGGDSERDTPVPIPNTEVKPFSADGTWLETARESRTLPDPKDDTPRGVLFFLALFVRISRFGRAEEIGRAHV